jgi:hypothetical protein
LRTYHRVKLDVVMEWKTPYFRDTALHNQKVGIVDVELNTLKQELDLLLCRFVSVQDIFRYIG